MVNGNRTEDKRIREEISVRLTSTLQRASSVYAILRDVAGHLQQDLFDSHLIYTASIQFISSLLILNTLSVCLMSSPRPNDYYIAFFVFIPQNAILIQQ